VNSETEKASKIPPNCKMKIINPEEIQKHSLLLTLYQMSKKQKNKS